MLSKIDSWCNSGGREKEKISTLRSNFRKELKKIHESKENQGLRTFMSLSPGYIYIYIKEYIYIYI